MLIMADCFLLNIYVRCFLACLIFLGRESHCHSFADILHYPAEECTGDLLLCRQCGANLADSDYIVSRWSPEALITLNRTLFGKQGVEIQVLSTAVGFRVSVITLSIANCIGITKDWRKELPWFPGFAWKSCVCEYCGDNLGWMFEPVKSATNNRLVPSNKGFYALMLSKIFGNAFADSLIVIPKSYKN